MTKDLQATFGTPLVELLLWRIELEGLPLGEKLGE